MILKIKVKPGSGKQEITKISNDEYLVSLKQRAEDNKANIELIKLLKKYLKVEVGDINIIKGLKSKNKIIEIRG
jgi:uncharacterized protein